MYQAFAELYDELMDDVDYESWADYYTRLLSIYGIRNGKICECACGTGGLTIPLHRRGFQMTGVDISREMLWEAAQKSRKLGIAMPFVQQDMKALNPVFKEEVNQKSFHIPKLVRIANMDIPRHVTRCSEKMEHEILNI